MKWFDPERGMVPLVILMPLLLVWCVIWLVLNLILPPRWANAAVEWTEEKLS